MPTELLTMVYLTCVSMRKARCLLGTMLLPSFPEKMSAMESAGLAGLLPPPWWPLPPDLVGVKLRAMSALPMATGFGIPTPPSPLLLFVLITPFSFWKENTDYSFCKQNTGFSFWKQNTDFSFWKQNTDFSFWNRTQTTASVNRTQASASENGTQMSVIVRGREKAALYNAERQCACISFS